jgi:hypothetical protein
MKFRNNSDHVISLDTLGLPTVEPYAEIDIPDEHCTPKRTDGGQRQKSTIEQVAPQLQPSDLDQRAAWFEVPALLPRVIAPALKAQKSNAQFVNALASARCSS